MLLNNTLLSLSYSAHVAHTWDLKIGKCYIHTQLVTGVIGRQNHNVANTTGVTNMVSCACAFMNDYTLVLIAPFFSGYFYLFCTKYIP